ncbi:hypothetical protein BGZ98_004323 [Dissophora globulifera]|nr:hypothetical protein BGZ98_004323 [Dissophora globulifera]
MPFIQPTGVSMRSRSRSNSVASIIKSTNNKDSKMKKPDPDPDPEISCQVKNDWVKSANDASHVFTKTWKPVDQSVESVIVFVHDVLEHCERYNSLFGYMSSKGIEVQAFDLPGFGETGARSDMHGITGG